MDWGARASEERRHCCHTVRRQLRCTSSSPSPSDRRGVVAVAPALRDAIEPQAGPNAKRERQNNTRRERRRCRVVSVAAALAAIAVCGARRCRSHELRIVAAGVIGIATASSNVTTVVVDLSQFKFSVTALGLAFLLTLVVSAFDSIKFNVAASVIGVGDAAIVSVVLESPLLLRLVWFGWDPKRVAESEFKRRCCRNFTKLEVSFEVVILKDAVACHHLLQVETRYSVDLTT
ncbi:uncharacterized protein DS421_20g707390 [Arachis hypogaea]|nr:uncharacterized protein DS421_20g707390 [Arachis hypogaea]